MNRSAAQDRTDFTERVRRQLASRYRGTNLAVDDARFAIRVTAPGIDVTLPLAPLEHGCVHDPASAASQIAAFVRSVERQLTPTSPTRIMLSRLLWCVRSREYLAGLRRSDALSQRPLAGDLIAFVSETLPGSVMRGVARDEWEAEGHDEEAVRAAADANTRARFDGLPARIRGARRVPRDGWRLGGDTLFQGSALLVPDVLLAIRDRAEGDALIALPDRSVLLAVAANAPGAPRFEQRVLREWREAMNPCSHSLLVSDGTALRALPRRGRRLDLLSWLRD